MSPGCLRWRAPERGCWSEGSRWWWQEAKGSAQGELPAPSSTGPSTTVSLVSFLFPLKPPLPKSLPPHPAQSGDWGLTANSCPFSTDSREGELDSQT